MPSGRPPSSSNSAAGDDGDGYIEHRVSKLDTLAGIAIRYGVEVADVKRANGLVTDLQMFGHQTLKIPLSGKHPLTKSHRQKVPSTSGSSLQKNNAPSRTLQQAGSVLSSESRYKEKRSLSSAMDLLMGYYGLSSPAKRTTCNIEGMEMTSYHSDVEDHSEEEPFSPITVSTMENEKSALPNGNTITCIRKDKEISRLSDEYTPRAVSVSNVGMGEVDKVSETSVRRRSKVDAMNPASGFSENDTRQESTAKSFCSFIWDRQ